MLKTLILVSTRMF